MAFISNIKAGDFNLRVILKNKTFTQSDFGGFSESLNTVTTVWANKNVKSLRDVKEKVEGEERESYARFVFTIRYSSETKVIKSNWILEEASSNDQYEILGFVVDPRKEFIEIFAKEYLPTQNPNG